MNRITNLCKVYKNHISVPWQSGIAGIQKVLFAVYNKNDEIHLRSLINEFDIATHASGHEWHLIDVTDSFPRWMSGHRYRESYFEEPGNLDGYSKGVITEFTEWIIDSLISEMDEKQNDGTVIGLMGVGCLFGITKVSIVIEKIAPYIKGRLLVFFPGEYENNNYRLLDARDGWNYMATPLLAHE